MIPIWEVFAILLFDSQTSIQDLWSPYAAAPGLTAKTSPAPASEDFSACLSRSRGESSERPPRWSAADGGRNAPPDGLSARPERRETPENRMEPKEKAPLDPKSRAGDDEPPPRDVRDEDEPSADLIAPALFTPAANRAEDAGDDEAPQALEISAADPMTAPDVANEGVKPIFPAPTENPAEPPDGADGLMGESLAPELPPVEAEEAALVSPEGDAAQAFPAADAEALPFAHLIRSIHTRAAQENPREGQPASEAADSAVLAAPAEAVPAAGLETAAGESLLADGDGQDAAGDGDADANPLPLEAALSGGTPLSAMGLPQEEPPTAQIPSLSAQIAEKIQTGIGKSQNQCEIQLLPEHLGRVTVRLAMSEQGLSATIRAEDAAARNLIHDGLRELQETLERSGIRVSQVDVSGEAAAQLGSGGFQRNDRSGEAPGGGRRASGLRMRASATAAQVDERYAPPGEQQLTLTGIEDVQGYHVLA